MYKMASAIILSVLIFVTSIIPVSAQEQLNNFNSFMPNLTPEEVAEYLNENLRKEVEENNEKPEDERLSDDKLLLQFISKMFYT